MRLLLMSRCPPYPLHLGDRLIIWHLARELSQRGYEIDLIAFAQFASDHDEIHHYRQYFKQVTLIDETPRSPIQLLQRALLPFSRFPTNAKQAWSGAMWDAIEQHLRQYEYDLVHSFGGVQVYEFAHLLRDYPHLITPYESFSLYLQRAVQQTGIIITRLQHTMAQQYEHWMYTPYPRVVVLTEQDRAELLRLNPRYTVDVIPNGVDLDFFTVDATQERDAYTLLFVGNYEYTPNLDAALFLANDIMPHITRAIPDAQLQLVGNAPPPELQAYQSDSINVTGRVPDVRPYLAQCGVFVCPLRIGAGIKNKVLESLAMAAPTVATPLSVDGIAVQNGESIIIADEIDFAQATIALLRDAPLRQKLAHNGRAIIEQQYSWSSVVDRYQRLYDALRS